MIRRTELHELKPSRFDVPRPPEWLAQAEADLQNLLSLPPDWDSYGARPIQPAIVAAAAKWLQETMMPETPRPAVLPTVRGGVQFEWHTRGIDLEIELTSPDEVHVAYENADESDEWKLDLASAHQPVKNLLTRLSHS